MKYELKISHLNNLTITKLCKSYALFVNKNISFGYCAIFLLKAEHMFYCFLIPYCLIES